MPYFTLCFGRFSFYQPSLKDNLLLFPLIQLSVYPRAVGKQPRIIPRFLVSCETLSKLLKLFISHYQSVKLRKYLPHCIVRAK